MSVQLLEARRLYRELRSCTAQGAVSRGLQCARALATEPRFEAVLHPHARAVFQHIVRPSDPFLLAHLLDALSVHRR